MHQTSIDSTVGNAGVAASAPQPWVITLRGELDIASRDVVDEHFARASTQVSEHIVVDASEVTFLDCGGLDVLLAAAATSDRQVWLRAPSAPVRRIAELVGLAEHWLGDPSTGELRIA